MLLYIVIGAEEDPAAPLIPAVAAVPSVHIWDNDSDDVDGRASVPRRQGGPMRTDAPMRPVRGRAAKQRAVLRRRHKSFENGAWRFQAWMQRQASGVTLRERIWQWEA